MVTQEEFIKRCTDEHGDTYDYSKTVYVNSTTLVIIICRIHGKFSITPRYHTYGQGCRTCGIIKRTILQTKDTKNFISRAEKIHDGKYDYSLVTYINQLTKIDIICPFHGKFDQTPVAHLQGKGCHLCGNESGALIRTKSTEAFIDESVKIHKDTYEYDEVSYLDCRIPVKIRCKTHGIFEQTPNSHLSGHGCRTCRESHGEKFLRHFLQERDIPFEVEKTFDGCTDKRILRFDVHVPSLNLCIEFDGKQHFQPVEHFGGTEQFEVLRRCDNIKQDFCIKSKINLLRVTGKLDQTMTEKLLIAIKLVNSLKEQNKTFVVRITDSNKYEIIYV